MSIIDALKVRYATKKFDSSKIISESLIYQIKEAFNLTATSYGLQPIKLLVLKNKIIQDQLVSDTMNQVQVSQASHVLIFCIDTKIDTKYIVDYFERIKLIRDTPDDILKGFRDFLISDFENKSQENIEEWATKQAYIAMGNLLTVCASLGIDACPMEGFSSEAYDKRFKLAEKNLKSVLVMPIGFRAQDDMFANFKKVRKSLNDVIIDIK
jgi:nitroreductase/dihydropteridine reductase